MARMRNTTASGGGSSSAAGESDVETEEESIAFDMVPDAVADDDVAASNDSQANVKQV